MTASFLSSFLCVQGRKREKERQYPPGTLVAFILLLLLPHSRHERRRRRPSRRCQRREIRCTAWRARRREKKVREAGAVGPWDSPKKRRRRRRKKRRGLKSRSLRCLNRLLMRGEKATGRGCHTHFSWWVEEAAFSALMSPPPR